MRTTEAKLVTEREPTLADQVTRLYDVIAGFHATNLIEIARELGGADEEDVGGGVLLIVQSGSGVPAEVSLRKMTESPLVRRARSNRADRATPCGARKDVRTAADPR